jgi:hypothetical protein
MSKWPHDDTASKTKFFGRPGTNLVSVIPPFQMYYNKHPIKSITVNKMVATSLLLVFNEILDKCGHDQKKVDEIGASAYGGCYNDRPIRGSKNISNHAFAAAIDIDPIRLPLGSKKRPNQIIYDAFKNQGALSGADYSGRKDPMHWEFVSR